MKSIFPVTASFAPDGNISLAGLDLANLVQEYGTPLYLYDAATVRVQVERLRRLVPAAYPGEWQITYAAKAYFSLGFARKLAGLGIGVDVVSLGELEAARRAGFPPDSVHVHGNNKSETELRAAAEWGTQAVVLDSLEEIEFFDCLCHENGLTARVWLRVSPGVDVHTHKAVQTAHHATKFGLPIVGGQAAEGIRLARGSRTLTLTGLHTHLGSQIFEPEPYCEAVSMLCDLADRSGFVPQEISPGGGWGVPYTSESLVVEPELWIRSVGESLHEESQRRGWPLPKLIVEPGRWISARAGLAVYSVGTVKRSGDGTRMVAVDGGMADNPRPALYGARYTAHLIPRVLEGRNSEISPATIAGKFCESGDLLIEGVPLPEACRGDLLVIPAAGAYQLSMSSNYNLSQRPAVLWLDEGWVEVLQARENLQAGWWFQ